MKEITGTIFLIFLVVTIGPILLGLLGAIAVAALPIIIWIGIPGAILYFWLTADQR